MRWLFVFVLLLNVIYLVWQIDAADKGLYDDVPALRNIEPIVLLHELTDAKKEGDLDVVGDASSGPEGTVVDMPVIQKCFTLGPFRQLDNLKKMQKEVKSLVEKVSIRDREEQEYTVHWVYIKPEKNRKDIIAVGKRLKAKKVKDFYLIREGEKNNGISLGHFNDKDRAFGLAAKVKKLGFNVEIEPIYRTYDVFWLDYQLKEDTLPGTIVEKYTQLEKQGKVGRLRRNCDR